MQPEIVIVNYGMGNLGSISNMLKKLGYSSIISSQKTEIEKADKLILPGVGAFNTAMQKLKQLDIIDLLNQKALIDKTPVLGICLGMQLFANHSEEGMGAKGFGWISGKLIRFRQENAEYPIRIPHMGWNLVFQEKKSRLFENMYEENKFYFVHSYHYVPDSQEDILLTTNYGYKITAAVERENIFGVQFHPEKSHKFGMKLLRNFIDTV